MISKKLCEITQFPEFAMKSHLSVGFRERDEKVSAPDLMVVSGRYNLMVVSGRYKVQSGFRGPWCHPQDG